MAKKLNLKCWKCGTEFDPDFLESERNRRQLPSFSVRCPATIEEAPGVSEICNTLNHVEVVTVTAAFRVSKPE